MIGNKIADQITSKGKSKEKKKTRKAEEIYISPENWKLEDQNNGATMFSIIEKSEETTLEFLQNSANIL